nr:immunoglobulin heavy chain junction region [Mus musculus]
CTGDDGFYW